MNKQPNIQPNIWLDKNQSDIPVMDEQTTFAEEQPLFDPLHTANGNAPTQKKKSARLIIVGIAAGVFLLIFVLAFITMKRQAPIFIQPSPTPAAEQQTAPQSAMEKTLNLLHEDVLRADPRTSDLPFPPVNFELYIQPKQ